MMNLNTARVLALITGLLLASTLSFSATAQTAKKAFKCVDSEGRIAYRELAQEGVECTLIQGTRAPTTDPDEAMAKLRQQVETAEPPQPQPEQTALSNQQQKQKNCETARKNLSILEGENDVVSTDNEGNKTLLQGEQRNAALAKTRKDIEYWCG